MTVNGARLSAGKLFSITSGGTNIGYNLNTASWYDTQKADYKIDDKKGYLLVNHSEPVIIVNTKNKPSNE